MTATVICCGDCTGVPEGDTVALTQHAVAVAYFGVGPSTQEQWDAIRAGSAKVSAVIPDGSFRTLADPAAAITRFTALRQQGQDVLGYVWTGAGDRHRALVLQEVDEWYTRYGSAISGVYLDSGMELDLGTPDATYRAYYQGLIDGVGTGDGIRQRHPAGRIGLAASQYKYDWVLTADYVTIFEGTAQTYINDATYKAIGEQHLEDPPAWWSENPARVVATVVQAAPGDLSTVLAKSVSRNTGNLYVYDGQTGDYGHLSTLWDGLLAGLAGQPKGGKGCLPVLVAAALGAAAGLHRGRWDRPA